MLEPVDAQSELIPPQGADAPRSSIKKAELGTIT